MFFTLDGVKLILSNLFDIHRLWYVSSVSYAKIRRSVHAQGSVIDVGPTYCDSAEIRNDGNGKALVAFSLEQSTPRAGTTTPEHLQVR